MQLMLSHFVHISSWYVFRLSQWHMQVAHVYRLQVIALKSISIIKLLVMF